MSINETKKIHLVIEKDGVSGHARLRNVNVSTLTHMRHAGRLTLEQVTAGFRLKRDFQQSALMSLKTSDAARVVVDGGFNASGLEAENVLDAQDRVRSALNVLPVKIAQVISDVCLFEYRLSHIDRMKKWRKGKASSYLKDGLDQLDDYYQKVDQEQAHETRLAGLGHSYEF